ncbi:MULTISPECIES: CHRD domain-containing protein [unclassified Streptomyces]|uniref:CHRD domain-containing protein n=1 Tax=unclassified Streptomyces TaxID=2593676 RepID=UPI00382AAEF3
MRQHTARGRIISFSAAAALALLAASPAAAHGGTGTAHGDGHGGGHDAQGTVTSVERQQVKPAQGKPTFLRARLSGDQEVPAPGQSHAGDADGSGEALVEVKGDRVIFSLRWNGIGAPTLGHIHQGRAGTNGDVQVGLFTTPMPVTVSKAVGAVSVTDKALAQKLRTDPSGFYVNLHDAANPAGAIRGQLKPLHGLANPLGLSRESGLAAIMSGGQEVPNGDASKVGDPDGAAVAFLRPKGTQVGYNLTWVNLTPPTLAHLHKGRFGQNGPVQVPLFATAIPQNIFSVAGTAVNQDPAVVQRIKQNPGNYYANLHTADKPDGAVRGQLFGKGTAPDNQNNDQNQGGDQNQNTTPPATPAAPAKSVTVSQDVNFGDPSEGLAPSNGQTCQNTRFGRLSVQTTGPVKIWEGKDCTGKVTTISSNVADVRTLGLEGIGSVRFL